MFRMKQTLVVIEDDKPIRDMYVWKLKAEGFKVFNADNGQSGISVIEEVRPDLILLDIRMPIMGGDDMLEKLRSTDWGSSIRVIILTNLSKDEAPHKLRFLNVDRYIVKAHSTPGQVLSTINDVLGIKS
jgi:two-component system, OmpR family, alkaline phosphatase synthesis response regulator PhoP